MTFDSFGRLAGAFAAAVFLASAPAALAQTVPIELQMDIENSAVLDVAVDSGEVAVRGADIDHVVVRALITVDKRLSGTDPIKAGSMLGEIKRSPPIDVNGDHISITSLKKRTQQRYITMAYDIQVPRDAKVTVHSNSGDVTVSGVTGPVEATSGSGEVTVAASPAAHSANES